MENRSSSAPNTTGSNSVSIEGKNFQIHRTKEGTMLPPPIKRKHSNSFRTVMEEQLNAGEWLELNRAEMVRARSQLSNAKSKAKKAGKPLPFGFVFRTEIKDKVYRLFKVIICFGIIAYFLYDYYSDRIADSHPASCTCSLCIYRMMHGLVPTK